MWAVVRVGIVELVIRPIIASFLVVLFVERNDVDDGLRVLFLFLLSDAVGLQSTLPFFGKALVETVSM